MRALRIVNLAPPLERVQLRARLDHDDCWRFEAWDGPDDVEISAESPATTCSMAFRNPE
jgi:hypothetical protein